MNNNFLCDKIDTLILSGGGTHGIAYLPILKYLKTNNILDNITKYYGVSAGSLTALCFSIGLSYDEAYDIFLNKINFTELMDFKIKNILTITKTLGLTDGTKLENIIKYILELKGFNPYITLLDLYNITKKELYIGATALIKGEFTLFNYKSHPNLPVWVAIRMSCSIPILFTPLRHYEINDLYVDGGLLNNNPINLVINELISISNNTNLITNTSNSDISDSNSSDSDTTDTDISDNENILPYKFNFICITLDTFDNNITDISSISFFKYLHLIIRKIFTNQSHKKDKYKDYIITIDSHKYKFINNPKSEDYNDNLNNMFNEIYDYFSNQFTEKIKNIC